MKRYILILVVIFVLSLTIPNNIFAARSRARPSSGQNVVTTTSGVGTSVRFRSDRRAVNINFSNLNAANSVTYSLSYTANGIPQGAQGTIASGSETNTTREVLFGTCSKNVCTYHYNITNAKLEIRSKLKNGKITVKTYRLKV